MEIWRRITGTTGKLGYQNACWRRIGGAQSALCVWALNRWDEGTCPEAQEWVEQTLLLGQVCGCFTSNVFLYIRHRAGEVELTTRELKACSHPEMIEAAERLLESRPDLLGGEQAHTIH